MFQKKKKLFRDLVGVVWPIRVLLGFSWKVKKLIFIILLNIFSHIFSVLQGIPGKTTRILEAQQRNNSSVIQVLNVTTR